MIGDEPALCDETGAPLVCLEHLLDFVPDRLIRPAELIEQRVPLRRAHGEGAVEDGGDSVPQVAVQADGHAATP